MYGIGLYGCVCVYVGITNYPKQSTNRAIYENACIVRVYMVEVSKKCRIEER